MERDIRKLLEDAAPKGPPPFDTSRFVDRARRRTTLRRSLAGLGLLGFAGFVAVTVTDDRLSSPTVTARPEATDATGDEDAAGQLRLEPGTPVPGERFGVAFEAWDRRPLWLLDRRTDVGWVPAYVLIPGSTPRDDGVTSFPVPDDLVVEDMAVDTPGPEIFVLPDDVEDGTYRVRSGGAIGEGEITRTSEPFVIRR